MAAPFQLKSHYLTCSFGIVKLNLAVHFSFVCVEFVLFILGETQDIYTFFGKHTIIVKITSANI